MGLDGELMRMPLVLGGNLLARFLGPVLKPVLFEDRNRDRLSPHKLDEVGVTAVMGIGDDDLVPGIQKADRDKKKTR